MTGFDIYQLCAHYGIHELELLSFSMVEMEFVAPNLPNKMGPEARQRWDAFDNIHIGFQGWYKHNTGCYYKFTNAAKSVGMDVFTVSILVNLPAFN